MAQDSFCFPFPDVLKENDLYSKLKYKSYCFGDFKKFLSSSLEFCAKNQLREQSWLRAGFFFSRTRNPDGGDSKSGISILGKIEK